MTTIFAKIYEDEALYDLMRDVSEAISGEMNPKMNAIPRDEHGFCKGEFVVSIIWCPPPKI